MQKVLNTQKTAGDLAKLATVHNNVKLRGKLAELSNLTLDVEFAQLVEKMDAEERKTFKGVSANDR